MDMRYCRARDRVMKTAHFVARTFFSVLSCLARARLSNLLIRHVRVGQICASHFALVMFLCGLLHCASKTPLYL